MDDQELRSLFKRLYDDVEEMRDDIRSVEGRMTSMQLSDADVRADVKIATGNLNNAADALARTALSLQKSELRAAETPDRKLKGVDIWLVRIAAAALVIALLALGGKEVVLKLFGG